MLRKVGILIVIGLIVVVGSAFLIHQITNQHNDKQEGPARELLYGSWLEPIPGQEEHMQGFLLNEDGSAESINMATLKYHSWELEGRELVLSYESIGNGVTFQGKRSFIIDSLDQHLLRLKNGDLILNYRKSK